MWKDAARLWVEGTSYTDAINAATAQPNWSDIPHPKDTIKQALERLLNPNYSTSYEKFVSTAYHKKTSKPEDYLSLEYIHNNLHVSSTKILTTTLSF